jgi:hypothetical protein
MGCGMFLVNVTTAPAIVWRDNAIGNQWFPFSGDFDMLKFRFAMMVAVGLVSAQVAFADFVIQNGGFEEPVIPAGAPDYNVYNAEDPTPLSIPGWTLQDSDGATVGAGILSQGALVTWGVGPVPQGAQCLTVGGGGGAWFEQTVNVTSGSTEQLRFAGSGYGGTWQNTATVTLDDVPLTFAGNSTVSLGDSSWKTFTSDAFSVTAGSHVLRFNVTDLGNVDSVGVVPEPSVLVLLTGGLLSLLAYAWRKRK